jgi:hypothetical protein
MQFDYETSREIRIDVDGVNRPGRYRVMSGSVIVYYGSEIKFAGYGVTSPELVAKWLLSDLVRRVESRKRKSKRQVAKLARVGFLLVIGLCQT